MMREDKEVQRGCDGEEVQRDGMGGGKRGCNGEEVQCRRDGVGRRYKVNNDTAQTAYIILFSSKICSLGPQ